MIQIINHNTLTGIPLADNSVDCVVTSPPYWGLRDYGTPGQLGIETTPAEYVENMRIVFADVRRVLKPCGTLWLNLGDSYASSKSNNGGYSAKSTLAGFSKANTKGRISNENYVSRDLKCDVKPKDLCGIPWRVAFALQADGWYLRSDIIWHKPNPMPESVTDRCTRAHEYVFHMSKSAKYFYDAGAIREEQSWNGLSCTKNYRPSADGGRIDAGMNSGGVNDLCRNRRTVWTIATQPTPDAHFATYPEKLVEPCILAGCPVGGTVLDPFCGSGTTLKVAERLGRNAIGLELNPEYIAIAERKTAQSYLEGVA